MCSICHSSPCLSGCPNAPDPPAAFRCHDCDEAIYPGDEYAKIDGVEYCEQCIDNYPYCVLIPLLGGEWKTVQDGEVITVRTFYRLERSTASSTERSSARSALTRSRTAIS